jgi:NAD(P)-dependent dehydrogenase (short-subunit alcohol dehydrogenase family)
MKNSHQNKNLLHGKSAIITGGSEGLGLKIAEAFLKNGANIVICGRNQEKINQALKMLQPFCTKNTVIGKVTDIANQAMCEDLVKTCLHHFNGIDVLVNNAGIHGAKGPIDEVNWELWESAIDINLKGTAFLCRAVLPHMKKQRLGKIIILSGGGATKPMPFMSAYAASKAALVRFGECLAEEVKPFHIDVNCIAPGALNTALLDDVITSGPQLIGMERYQQALEQQKNGGDDPENAAKLSVFLSSEKSNGITGKLISAIWDPWENLLHYRDQLMNSDIYTLRRITPNDRNQDWTS